MTDREMLELAAKAAGYSCRIRTTKIGIEKFYVNGHVWNPLIDDGDALRLAVKLGLMLDEITQGYMAGHWVATHTNIESCYELAIPDPYAATRRAIVRAAAEIGKGIVQTVSNDLPEDNYYKTQAEAVEVAAAAIRKGE